MSPIPRYAAACSRDRHRGGGSGRVPSLSSAVFIWSDSYGQIVRPLGVDVFGTGCLSADYRRPDVTTTIVQGWRRIASTRWSAAIVGKDAELEGSEGLHKKRDRAGWAWEFMRRNRVSGRLCSVAKPGKRCHEQATCTRWEGLRGRPTGPRLAVKWGQLELIADPADDAVPPFFWPARSSRTASKLAVSSSSPKGRVVHPAGGIRDTNL